MITMTPKWGLLTACMLSLRARSKLMHSRVYPLLISLSTYSKIFMTSESEITALLLEWDLWEEVPFYRLGWSRSTCFISKGCMFINFIIRYSRTKESDGWWELLDYNFGLLITIKIIWCWIELLVGRGFLSSRVSRDGLWLVSAKQRGPRWALKLFCKQWGMWQL